MDWYNATTESHRQTFSQDCQLSALSEDWQRELAALWRLEADVNNGAYLQFISNWGRESYTDASQALKKIGALKMADLVDRCQALVDEHVDLEAASGEQRPKLMPNRVIGPGGEVLEEAGSVLPDNAIERIYELSQEFMEYPDDIATLGVKYYGSRFDLDAE